jgi:hypothetical protein
VCFFLMSECVVLGLNPRPHTGEASTLRLSCDILSFFEHVPIESAWPGDMAWQSPLAASFVCWVSLEWTHRQRKPVPSATPFLVQESLEPMAVVN